MQTVRIHMDDASCADVRISDIQFDEFRRWLRFANQRDEFNMPGVAQKLKRKSIAWTEVLPEETEEEKEK